MALARFVMRYASFAHGWPAYTADASEASRVHGH